ncbi:aminofutalosine synthase MqnE [Pelotomaculum terephthalicicum JT]|uniref:aminofutalosine synthase MqnE n=1 Tax=Pelotomaculum TaxID=191373 RepID=UPI0009D153B9|nr:MULTISPECIES: aminofutalosine synthase MqnE [Pelotomaculum]MCG9966470.1 aminofutalosine synthase MqnE [Pelotomaculum terephthalicicum JT]OPX85967.1 MAG: Aminodeoxyfutalosine synthase [Pelotomaculum sp. PtaB.Bin117]OPY63389.1 MAG: Aminodeoxyfutalosine synthase [Pelotomaculum sp. PtaU1.Bin065]
MELVLDGELADLERKILAGERLSRADGVRLYQAKDLLAVGRLADLVRRRKNGDKAYFIVNRHINHTNVCENLCKLCAFGLEAGHPRAYTLSLDEIEAKALASAGERISEIHIVGGLNPDLKMDYYVEMLRRIRRALPDVMIQSFTAVEVDYLARVHNMPVEEVLAVLREAGLDSLPGGGAEIFSPRVRKLICPRKISGERWLEVHLAAHKLGMRTNATMLYGHVETAEERVDHLVRLREAQDISGGFLTFIPLAFHPQNTGLEPQSVSGTTGFDDLKALAVARLMLDNFDHIKAFWIMIGPKLAQVSLTFGVDDLDGTVVEEKIAHDAGAATGQFMSKAELVKMIRAAGRKPVERDTLYNVIEEVF